MDVFAQMADDIFGDANLGRDATYTPVGGSGVAVTLVRGRSGDRENDNAQARINALERLYELRKSEAAEKLPGGEPRHGDAVEVDGAVYEVDGVRLAENGLTWVLGLVAV